MKNFLYLPFVIMIVVVGLLTAVAQAEEYELEVIAEIPLGKLAFVTGSSFGSTGTIVIVGQEAPRMSGGGIEAVAVA